MLSPSLRLRRVTIVSLTALAVAGCASGDSIEDMVPRAALDPQPDRLPPPSTPGGVEGERAASVAASEPSPGADAVFAGTGRPAPGSGNYPNINVQPRGATRQLSPDEAASRRQQMEALSEALSDGRISAEEYRRKLGQLQALAATHSGDTLKKIEE